MTNNNRQQGKKRVGRGYGSGKGGHTVGLGTKGQKSRGRRGVPIGFEGGQVPLYKKMPKIAYFSSRHTKDVFCISLRDLNGFKAGETITPATLAKKGWFTKVPRGGVKLLANGDLAVKLILKGFLLTAGTIKKLEKTESSIVEA